MDVRCLIKVMWRVSSPSLKNFFITAEGFVICDVTAKIFVVHFHKIKSWNLRNLCILVEHAPGVGHTATELVPASGDECYLLIFSWAVSPHVPPPPPPPSRGFNWLVHNSPEAVIEGLHASQDALCFWPLLSTSLCHLCLRDSSNRGLDSPFLLRFSFLAFNKLSQFPKIELLQFSIVYSNNPWKLYYVACLWFVAYCWVETMTS